MREIKNSIKVSVVSSYPVKLVELSTQITRSVILVVNKTCSNGQNNEFQDLETCADEVFYTHCPWRSVF